MKVRGSDDFFDIFAVTTCLLAGVTYSTEYIGTYAGFDAESEPRKDGSGKEITNATRKYSEEIGNVLASSSELHSTYTLSGDELYVRLKSPHLQVKRIG
ncbi:MAG: hypothetical protein ACOC90_09180 [Bacteroidota bacterium]